MDNKYVIATGYSRANLCEHVSRYIENGWHPIGGMVIDFNDEEDDKVYCQPMTVLSCLLYTSPSPRDGLLSRMPSSA